MMFVAISGLHGSGKSTAARGVAKQFGWRYYSTGQVFREMARERGMSLAEFNQHVEEDLEIDRQLDARMVEAAKEGGVVVEGQMVAFLTRNLPDGVRVLLKCPRKTRVQRMGERDNESFEAKLRETKVREESARKRFKMLHGVDIADPEEIMRVYDLILDSSLFDAESVVQTIVAAVKGLQAA